MLSWVVSNVILALVLALAAWSAQRWLLRPAVAHTLWVLALVKLVTPPLVNVPLGQSPGPVACALGTCGCDHRSPTQAFVRDTLPWVLLAAWSAGAGTTAWVAWRRWGWRHFDRLGKRLHRILRRLPTSTQRSPTRPMPRISLTKSAGSSVMSYSLRRRRMAGIGAGIRSKTKRGTGDSSASAIRRP